MKRLKLCIWIIILMVVKITVLNRIGVFSSAPDPLFAFVIAYAIIEEEFSFASVISVICGVCSGALSSFSSFPVSVLTYVYSALIVIALRNRARHIPNFAKTIFWTGILSFAGCSVSYFVMNLSYETEAVLKIILPFTVYNMLAAAIIYPLAKKTLVVIDEKKKLIPD